MPVSGPAHTLIGMSTALTIMRPIVQVHPVLKSSGWTFGWDALAAIGTIGLAIVTAGMAFATFRLARQARDEARAVKDNSGVVKEQVELQRAQAEAAQRPLVVPAPSAGWTDGKDPYNSQSGPPPWALVLPVKNVGPGAALNVTGHIDFGPLFSDKPDRTVRLVPTSLASSESQDLRLDWRDQPNTDWSSATDKLDYEDVAGGRWETFFDVDVETGRRYIRVKRTVLAMRADGTVPQG
jgi:hypothetical protein